jgi:hypothetical protein
VGPGSPPRRFAPNRSLFSPGLKTKKRKNNIASSMTKSDLSESSSYSEYSKPFSSTPKTKKKNKTRAVEGRTRDDNTEKEHHSSASFFVSAMCEDFSLVLLLQNAQ